MLDLSGCLFIVTVGGLYLGPGAFSSLWFDLYVITRDISAIATPYVGDYIVTTT
jgi:hypothetical protein